MKNINDNHYILNAIFIFIEVLYMNISILINNSQNISLSYLLKIMSPYFLHPQNVFDPNFCAIHAQLKCSIQEYIIIARIQSRQKNVI